MEGNELGCNETAKEVCQRGVGAAGRNLSLTLTTERSNKVPSKKKGSNLNGGKCLN